IRSDYLVDATVVFRNLEPREQPAVVVGLRAPNRSGCLFELLAAEVKVVFDHPAASDGLPEKIDRSSGRQTFGDGFDLGTDDGLVGTRVVQREGFRRSSGRLVCRWSGSGLAAGSTDARDQYDEERLHSTI